MERINPFILFGLFWVFTQSANLYSQKTSSSSEVKSAEFEDEIKVNPELTLDFGSAFERHNFGS